MMLECVDLKKQYRTEYYLRNRERELAARRKRYADNIDEERSKRRDWRDDNPNYSLEYYHRTKGRKVSGTGKSAMVPPPVTFLKG